MKKVFSVSVFIFIFIPVFFIHAQGLPVPVKILLVPGHDNEIWGAQYGNVKEAYMNLAVATRIYNIFKKDNRFEVYITRDENGYIKEFADYFKSNKVEVLAFKENAKKKMKENISDGSFIEKENTPHNSVSEDISLRLYGFNKWANENNVDAVVHIHFNDYQRKNKWKIGNRKGFAIYIPDLQMANGFESGQLADNIFTELKKKYNTSNYVNELGGLVTSQKLIALGSNGTLSGSVRSVLIEYGYVYEKRFRNYATRHQAYDDMAKLTATGIENYFFNPTPFFP